MDRRPVVTILPSREQFAPGRAGAISLLVHRLAGADDVVVGAQVDAPFGDVAFCPAVPSFWDGGRYVAAVARTIRTLRPAMIEVHNRPDVALALARRFARLPMMLILHNDPQAMRRAGTPGQRVAILRRMRVATVSGWLRDRFLEGVPAPRHPVEVAPNCIDLAALPPPLPTLDRERTILFAGRVVADKGADAFVAACAALLPGLPGWRAEMIGADRFGPDSPETPFLAELRPRARAAGVEMAGYQSHDRVLAAMARAAIVVVPSRWQEPFGMAALEAMACGAALVASPHGGLAEVVGDAALLADPDPVAGLAEAIGRLAGSEALRAELSGRGVARARGFTRPAARARLEDLRRACIAGGSPPRA
ncbi:hexosyltransferase [Gluconacetobacter johannae DSM 13595]|uniref:Glycosyltransferase family 4 protein n=1 Tax=Gluconacetobacter johannae TaxID=112140 RepID=A0A7W4P6D7_9PROT|nr:glycosyltransferase family 4 protein [Gluconacetobacter johannae]MBB2177133.1 glycosyltransferase family 4 protein [Gluconacetobacter johannae]GBQ90949.1 hexosyltransferase [Gluconacetobacter johannae DSM 13595]